MPIIIYGLIDPRTNEIRYVGKTSQRLKYRISSHMRDTCNCHRTHWLKELASIGSTPIGTVLEEVHPGDSWQERERWWISELRASGKRLTNNTDGGDGVSGLPEETRKRMARVWVGRKHRPESIAKICAARVGFRHLQETKDWMRGLMRNRDITWGPSISAAVSKLADADVALISNRLRDGERVKDIAKEYGLHRTTVSKIKMGTYAPKRKQDA
jgi:hypothetical protein